MMTTMRGAPIACRLFGQHVLTHIAPHHVHAGDGAVGLEIVPAELATELSSPVLSVPMRHPDGEGQYEVWQRGDALILRIAPVATFRCTANRLEYHRAAGISDEALQWQTFGLVLSAWSEWAGRPVLHAATVEVGGTAVGFLGRSGVGKSSLTLEFLTNGHRILGDDQLILERGPSGMTALPAIPWLKLGPDVVARTGLEHLPRIHSGSDKRRRDVQDDEWVKDPVPVGPIYIVERGSQRAEIVIEPVPPGESMLALIRNSYVPRTVVASGVAGRRMPLLASVVEQHGVWRLNYPDGVEWLPRIRAAVARHVGECVSARPVPSRR
jgi:hypothetical protein